MTKIRTVVFYKDYFETFFIKQTDKVKKKIVWTLNLIEEVQTIPETYLKHLKGTQGLYEVRIQSGNNIYRVFCFFDQGKIVVIMNGFQKKSQKTPKGEIEKALKIKKEYEQEQK
ncbi:type II toxin-antitoxin system RelE/ParE family toxin [Roseivirga echinicomitans]